MKWLRIAVLILVLSDSQVCKTGSTSLKMKNKDRLAVYNRSLAVTLAHYSSAVYLSDLMGLFTWTCSRCKTTKGFEMLELIVDVEHCLQAFVGFAKDLNAAVIAFRGTQATSIQNWIIDLDWWLADIDYPNISNAKVHHGFYSAYHDTTIRPAVVNAVRKANELYGNIKILVTGHSLGGAMAALCALDLKITGEAKNVQVSTYGMPRIGNIIFAAFYNDQVPDTIRVTSERDIVPHLPPYSPYFPCRCQYHHFPREVWIRSFEDGCFVNIIEVVCNGSGEDPCCSRSLDYYSVSDHMHYYGLNMSDNSPDMCYIVMDPGLDKFTTRDSHGNLIFSRTPSI